MGSNPFRGLVHLEVTSFTRQDKESESNSVVGRSDRNGQSKKKAGANNDKVSDKKRSKSKKDRMAGRDREGSENEDDLGGKSKLDGSSFL